ncbi:MAG: hypothetical protein AB1480_14555 [Nitrospirota bacterium]
MAKKIKKRIKTKHFSELIPGRVKMSEVLLDYAEPLLKEADNIKSRHVAISMAVLCWNISLMPEDKQKEMIEDVLAKILKTSGDYDATRSIMIMLIERKKMFFSEYSNYIVDYEISLTDGGNLHLTVMSAEK